MINKFDLMSNTEIIDHATGLLNSIPASNASEKSQKQYWRQYLNLITSTQIPMQIAHRIRDTDKKATYNSLLTSARFGIRCDLVRVLENLRAMDVGIDETDVRASPLRRRNVTAELVELEQRLDALREITPPDVIRKRHSKRKDLVGLPKDWRQRVVDASQKYKIPCLVSAITGCRPIELAKGVELGLDGNWLFAIIAGAKVTERAGQPLRFLIFRVDPSSSTLVRQLASAVRQQGGTMTATIANTKAFSSAVRDTARRLWPRRKRAVTPYSFRHASASDWKASGLPIEKLAQALGHSVADTQRYYGYRASGDATGAFGAVPVTIAATRTVKKRSGPFPIQVREAALARAAAGLPKIQRKPPTSLARPNTGGQPSATRPDTAVGKTIRTIRPKP